MLEKTKKIKFGYEWVIVSLCFLMIFACLGFCSSGKSFYLTAITEALHIPRGLFSINDSCRYVATAVVNLFFGKMFHRFGAKKLMAAGFVCLIASCLIYSFATNIWVFYLGGILLGVGFSWSSTTMVSAVIHKWCKKHVGTIMGAVLAANGIGGALAVQIITPIIFQEGNPFGYRAAYRLSALIVLVVAILVMIFMKEEPEGGSVAVASKRKAQGEGWAGIEYSEGSHKTYFYMAAIGVFFTGMILQGISGIATPHMLDVGLDPAFVTLASSFSSLILAGSKFFTGFLFDRFGLRTTMNVGLAASLLTMVSLIMITNSTVGRVFVVGYIIFSAIALPLETVMLPLYVSGFFGDKSYNQFLGIFVSINSTGYALGTPIANFCYDAFGNYQLAFIASGVIMFFVLIIMQFVCKEAKKEKLRICAE